MARVIQVTETGEEFYAFQGSYQKCEQWIDENYENFPESRFYIESI